MEDDNKEPSINNENNSDLDKKAVEMKLFFYTSSAQRNCNSAIVKLELFGNISLIPDANDLEHCGKVVYGVELSFTECNPSNIKGVKSSFAKCNPSVIQRVESFFVECNTSVPAKHSLVDDSNDVKLLGDTMIKAKGYLFMLMTAISKYIKTFGFDENCLIV